MRDQPDHGTRNRYRKGCRCTPCKDAAAASRKKYRETSGRVCTQPGCSSPALARGLCPSHYSTWHRQTNGRASSSFTTAGARRRNARRRARSRDAFVADVDRAEILQRDRWICGLCHKPIPRRPQYPHPDSAVLDHIIPLADGGTHEPRNVQAAHSRCNLSKGARGRGEQLRLIG